MINSFIKFFIASNKIILYALFFNICFINASEKNISQKWCESNFGISEYRTKYGTYVDCLTDEFAIEIEYDYKWKEAVGQSLHYAEATSKKPMIIIIKRIDSKKEYFAELNRVIVNFNLPIKVLVINEKDIL